ncbi:MAG TPA: hypothetical protein VFD49_13210 [Candidatus Dormibacteraeota bacterium]|nr:hypothetical protein [Candidatus Dormibacteraeota bacterium]
MAAVDGVDEVDALPQAAIIRPATAASTSAPGLDVIGDTFTSSFA